MNVLNHCSLFFGMAGVLLATSCQTTKPVKELEIWLQTPVENRNELTSFEFANTPMTKEEAALAKNILWQDFTKQKHAELKEGWENKSFTHGQHEMKFDYTVYGEKPEGGRSLYISMHGGGSTTPEFNDGQWDNQKRLYKPKEGVYLAPRATTDSWNMWHQANIDPLFETIILAASLFEEVNLDKVYLTGYSAGGDGTYQIAPRMSDRYAAAAMMAGHPNETSQIGFRNLPFSIYMGEKDGAFDRNKIAANWGQKLDSLQNIDKGGYIHDVHIVEGKGHWMDKADTAAITWMTQFERNSIPSKIVWKQDDVLHNQYYWLKLKQPVERLEAVVSHVDNHFVVEKNENEHLEILVNDAMCNLNKTITVEVKGVTTEYTVNRTIANLYETLLEKEDPDLTFSGKITL